MRRWRLPPPLPEPVLRLEGGHRQRQGRRLRAEGGVARGGDERRWRGFVGVQGLQGGRGRHRGWGRFGFGVPLVHFVFRVGPVVAGLQSLLRRPVRRQCPHGDSGCVCNSVHVNVNTEQTPVCCRLPSVYLNEQQHKYQKLEK